MWSGCTGSVRIEPLVLTNNGRSGGDTERGQVSGVGSGRQLNDFVLICDTRTCHYELGG